MTYTNLACPAGHEERGVSGPPVNVVQSAAAPQERVLQAQGAARSSLYDVLDLTYDDKLRDRMMDRAIEGRP